MVFQILHINSMKIEVQKKLRKKPEIILIVCEDSKSSSFYIEQKAKSVGIPLYKSIEKVKFDKGNVEIQGLGGDPIYLVSKAIERKNNFRSEQKRRQSYPFSKVFCVMDVDDHHSLAEAIVKINEENKKDTETEIIPIISNECFEVWYILHFELIKRELYRNSKTKRAKNKQFISPENNLSKLIEKYLGIKKYEKGNENIFELLKLKGNESAAIIRANDLNKHHLEVNKIKTNDIYKFNPSTQVHKLIIKLNEMSHNELEYKFETLQETDLLKIDYLCSNKSFILMLWELMHNTYSKLTYSERFILLIEIFTKPYNNKAFIEDQNIRDVLIEYYSNIDQN